MIRLPPTGIFLSESDIHFHMRQTEIYCGLMKQGFTREEIARYLQDYRESVLPQRGLENLVELPQTLSTVELSYRHTKVPSSREEDCHVSGKPKPDNICEAPVDPGSPDEEFGRASSNSRAVPSSPISDGESDDVARESPESLSANAIPFAMHMNKHAPRKSSLLRFSHAISSDSQSSNAEQEDERQIPQSLRTRKYRARSHTYPYASSDHELSSKAGTVSHELAERFEDISLDETLHKDHPSDSSSGDGMPLPYLPSTSVTHRRQNIHLTVPAADNVDPSPGDLPEASLMSGPLSALIQSRWADLLESFDSLEGLPSSPPVHSSPPHDASSPQPVTTALVDSPITPRSIRRADAFSRDQSEDHGPRFLDGSTFSVYNDSLPANTQPQTPSDLARGLLITEHEAAYTAPPGMLRFGSFSIPARGLHEVDNDLIEQSPTLRAMFMRERRGRELWRIVRAEGERQRRAHLRDAALLAGTPPTTRRQRMQTEEPWRDELDVDRVGEENFETDFTMRQQGAMRVVSGNARFEP